MPVKWSNYVIVRNWLDNTIRIARGKKASKGGYFVTNEKSHDVTQQAIAAVAEHMQTLFNQRKEETPDIVALELIGTDGSKLVWWPAADVKSEKSSKGGTDNE